MIKDIKLGVEMMKYGLNYQGAVVGVILAIGAGFLFAFLVPVGIISSLYVGIGVIAVVQLMYSESVGTMVQSSPYKKKLRTTIPTYIATISMLIANTLSVIMQWFTRLIVRNNTNQLVEIVYEAGEYEAGFLICSLCLVFILFYIVVARSFFWVSTILLIGGCMWFRFAFDRVEVSYLDISEGLAIFLSYVIVLLGCGVMHVFHCLTYKREYSELIFRSLLKRESS